MQLSLWHPMSCTHRVYQMTCEEFEQLWARANGLCERCRAAWHPLQIDHDHKLGFAAVRGLLCPKCNTHMKFVDAGTRLADEPTARYLRQSWHLMAARVST